MIMTICYQTRISIIKHCSLMPVLKDPNNASAIINSLNMTLKRLCLAHRKKKACCAHLRERERCFLQGD